jgi:hypothetical protein
MEDELDLVPLRACDAEDFRAQEAPAATEPLAGCDLLDTRGREEHGFAVEAGELEALLLEREDPRDAPVAAGDEIGACQEAQLLSFPRDRLPGEAVLRAAKEKAGDDPERGEENGRAAEDQGGRQCRNFLRLRM